MSHMEGVNPQTLDLIYQVTREGFPNQFREAESLDGKIVQVFSAGSVVIGLTGLTAIRQTERPDEATAFLVLAVVAYGVMAFAALWGVWIREIFRPYHSDTLLEDFWMDPVDEVKYALAHEMPALYRHNQAINDNKAWAIRAAIVTTAIEVVAVGAMVLWTI